MKKFVKKDLVYNIEKINPVQRPSIQRCTGNGQIDEVTLRSARTSNVFTIRLNLKMFKDLPFTTATETKLSDRSIF